MIRRATMAGEFLALDELRDGEMERWSVRQTDNIYTSWLLLVLVQDKKGCELPITGELGNLPDTIFPAWVSEG